MEEDIKKKSVLAMELAEQIKEAVDRFNVGGADYEQAGALAEELDNLCSIDTEYVIIEECPMARSGIMIRPCEIKVKE